jgi:pseudouridine kinase
MRKVIVIGGANVDIKGRVSGPYLSGTSNPGVVTVSAGGVGRNIADNLCRLDVEVSLITALGDDANGRFLRQACAVAGIDLSHALAGETTGTYLAVLDGAGELVSAVSDMRAIDRLEPAHLEAAAESLGRADMLVADCNIPVACLDWLCRFSVRSRVPLLVEPVSVPKAMKLLQLERIAPVFAITPNTQQLDALAGGDIAQLHGLGFANVVVHRGSHGALASDGSGVVPVEPATAAEITDVTGAGDAAVAGLVCGLLEKLALAEAARLGQCAAAIKLGSSESVAPGLSRDRLMKMAGLPVGVSVHLLGRD